MNRRHLALCACVLALPLAACGRDPFLSALPGAEDVSIRVPESAGQALSLGERSEFYETTRNVSRGINGGIAGVFGLMDLIVQHPPTVREENVRVWGPSEPRGLEDTSYKFTVELTGENEYSYKLEGKPKGSEDDAFVVIWDGVAYPGEDNVGTGVLNLHFSNARALKPSDCTVGDAEVTYDATNPERRTVDVAFDGVANACNDEAPTIATYHYSEASDGSGDFQFSANGNIHKAEEQKPLIETLTINSRWLATGAGRSDVVISGGEVPSDLMTYLPDSDATSVRATECWDDAFALTFSDTDPEELREHIRELQGDESACPFTDAAYPEAPQS